MHELTLLERRLEPWQALRLLHRYGVAVDEDQVNAVLREDRDTRLERWNDRGCGPDKLGEDEVDRLFFRKGGGRLAKAICNGCRARVQCALRALEEDARSDYPPAGVFGALTATERGELLEEARRVR